MPILDASTLGRVGAMPQALRLYGDWGLRHIVRFAPHSASWVTEKLAGLMTA